jgi:hypothetical protein
MLLPSILRPATPQRVTPILRNTYRSPVSLFPTITARPVYYFSSSSKLRYPQVPDKMRAVLIKDGKGPVENLYLGEEATPEPEEGQVQVQVS